MRRIAVFARRPSPGRVKTRLSPALPSALACDLYQGMLADAVAAAKGCRADRRAIYWTGAEAEATPLAEAFDVREQSDGDLGDRLEAAFAELLAKDGDRAVVIGADCPDLDAATLDRAFEALESRDLVLGPTGDGGYYLIGLARVVPGLLRDIDWSTDRVFSQTIEGARRAELTIGTLSRLDDLDTPDTLLRWIARASTAPHTASHTVSALRRIGLLKAE